MHVRDPPSPGCRLSTLYCLRLVPAHRAHHIRSFGSIVSLPNRARNFFALASTEKHHTLNHSPSLQKV